MLVYRMLSMIFVFYSNFYEMLARYIGPDFFFLQKNLMKKKDQKNRLLTQINSKKER